jgi:SAM-dependent methyltransferase
LEKLGDVRGKHILELGCGAGEASVYFAKLGAEVTATDISAGMLKVVEDVAKRHDVAVATRQIFSHQLPFDDATFDIVYAANLLHHVELEPTLVEVKRVLKKGGIFVSWDPLAHNPLINIYRSMATEVRTDDEHPLKISDLERFRAFFPVVEYDATWLLTLWIFLRFYMIERVDPNKERYWKKILVEHERLDKTFRRLERVDRLLLGLFPFLKRYCWNIVIFCKAL